MNVTLNKVAGENVLVFTIENQKSIIFVLNENGDKVEKIINDPQAIKNMLEGKSLEEFKLNYDILVPVKQKLIRVTGNKYCKTESGNLSFVLDAEGNVLKSCTNKEYDSSKYQEENHSYLLDIVLFVEEQRFLYYKEKREIESLAVLNKHSDTASESPFVGLKEKLKTN